MKRAQGPATVAEAIEWLRKRFRSEAAAGVSVTYQMELAGSDAGGLWLRVADGSLECGEGRTAGPDVVFALRDSDFFAILSGSANPDLLFTEERLEVRGDLSLALKLRSLFANSA